jgi:hypothetical protein
MKKQRWKVLFWKNYESKIDVEISAEWFSSEDDVLKVWKNNPYFIKAVRID